MEKEKLNGLSEKLSIMYGCLGDIEKEYGEKESKCNLSKKCLRLKRVRECCLFNILIDYCDNEILEVLKNDIEFIKMKNYYSVERKEGNKKIDFEGLSKLEVFEKYDLSIKNMEKKGYKLNEKDIYIKIAAGDN